MPPPPLASSSLLDSIANIITTTGGALKPYEYAPLDPSRRTFRLIELLPPRPALLPGCHGTVRVRIFERDVDADADADVAPGTGQVSAPPYDALSYTWDIPEGVTEPDRRIIVEPSGPNGDGVDDDGRPRELRIYRALELALLYLSPTAGGEDSDGEDGHDDIDGKNRRRRPLFVDQICLNQRDAVEKSVQVPLMRVIYARCARTLIWLGPPTRASDRYLDYVAAEVLPGGDGVLGRLLGPRVSSAMRIFDAVVAEEDPVPVQQQQPTTDGHDDQDKDEEERKEEHRRLRDDYDALLGLVNRCGDALPLDGMADVLSRPWNNRLWTIQEATLAPLVVFVCGRRTLCFDCMRAALFFFNVANTHWVRRARGGGVPRPPRELRARAALLDLGAGMGRIFQERKAVHRLRRRAGLMDVLLKYNVVGDEGGGVVPVKIGARLPEDRVFALLGLVDEADPLAARVRVRYGGEDVVARVYTEVTGMLLEETVDALLFAQRPRTTPGLPSWVIDWAMAVRLPVGYARLKQPVFAASSSCGKDAAPRAARFTVDDAAGRLTIRGVAVDKVVRVGEQTYCRDPEGRITELVDKRSARRVFEEVDEFVREARRGDGGGHIIKRQQDRDAGKNERGDDQEEEVEEEGDDQEEQQRAHRHTCLRVCDSGLSWRYFRSRLDSSSTTTTTTAAASMAKLSTLEASISNVGLRLLRADATRDAYRITRIYATIGITPWYWVPAPEFSALRLLACDPPAALRLLRDAAVDFVEDMLGLALASAAVGFAAWWVVFRRRFKYVTLRQDAGAFARVGLDPQAVLDPDMGEFTGHLLRNVGRRVYRTQSGRVGMGPAETSAGDDVVVLYGASVPHVLRDRGDGTNEFIGETYCDGIMDGEALDSGLEKDFVLT
ncbi:hypothetical protein JDV02_000313 [Purpureocillium takamizusanense]|uniref:Heterokaryon incompatibility domain-containing protein n=1 Tax=Purpureocillium takamizusanense TaxID=2060973 RepID=A0A9Q8Q4K1_9HYPO|nr:uncharacterized protein JDV02_000313 [Purpureocillium takamizusanense]UNI13584.1 hypothetical protein JDV02_000313 [Purpureocillium takamizusanense]